MLKHLLRNPLLLLLFVLHILLIIGCEKQSEDSKNPTSEQESKKYEIKLNVSGFSQTVGEALAVNSIGNNVQYLYYLVYNSSGSLVNSIEQSYPNDNFGTISDKLPTGSYTIVILASQSSLLLVSKENLQEAFYSYSASFSPAGDTFFKKIAINVTTENLNQNIVLNRIVALLQANIEDALPTDAYKIVLNVPNEATYFKFNQESITGNRGSRTVEKIIGESERGKSNVSISMFLLNTSEPLTANIRCYSSSNSLIAEKMVSSIITERNRKTILSGKLFEGINAGNASVSISLDTVWKAENINIKY